MKAATGRAATGRECERQKKASVKGLSIVIICLNEVAYLPRLIKSIQTQEATPYPYEVIVVDGGSTDGTLEALGTRPSSDLALKIFRTSPDPGSQRNAGAKTANYNNLLFIDADVILPSNMLRSIAMLRMPELFVAGVRHTATDLSLTDRLALTLTHGLIILAMICRVPALNGDFILTNKKTHFDTIRGFREGSLLGEDTDYGLRAVRAGATYRFIRQPAIVADPRRIRLQGRFAVLKIWIRAYVRNVFGKGPTPRTSAIHYPYGGYNPSDPGS